jgi:hypothetical protein
MTYQELQSQLKAFKNDGYEVNVKLNAKKEVLQKEYDRLMQLAEVAEVAEVVEELNSQSCDVLEGWMGQSCDVLYGYIGETYDVLDGWVGRASDIPIATPTTTPKHRLNSFEAMYKKFVPRKSTIKAKGFLPIFSKAA